MRLHNQFAVRALTLLLALCLRSSEAAVINITTNDDYSKIEGANPGDQVLIAPGTYAFRVYLTKQAPTNAIVIAALDPSNPPVWDFGTNLVENAPGSYTAGDRGRGGWQFSGAQNYSISGIAFRHCRTASFNSAGIRYYNGTTNLYRIQTNASAGPLTGSVQSASPSFHNPAGKDYTLLSSSACIGAANAAVYGPPGREYFQNEITNRMWRIRAAARDIGAFESTTTNSPVGPYDPMPLPRLGIGPAGSNAVLSWPLFAQDFGLYQSPFILPASWTLTPYAYLTNSAGVCAIASASPSNAFFRLQKQPGQ
jgi:hypothetical protein